MLFRSIVVILIVVTSTALAVVVSALSIGFVLCFSIITGAADICCTCEVRDSNVEVNVYAV